MSRRGLVPDRAMRTNLVVVSVPSLQLFAGVGKAQESVGIQAFGPQSTVERLDERVVGGLAWPREVQRHATVIGNRGLPLSRIGR